MLYKFINQPKLELLKLIFNIFLIISYMTTLSSCMTTYNYSESPESMETVSASEIKKIELKSGIMIDCKDKLIKFEKGIDSVTYIALGYHVTEDHKNYWKEQRISENDIYKIYLERSELNQEKTFLLVLGILVVTALVIVLIAFASTPDLFHVSGFR